MHSIDTCRDMRGKCVGMCIDTQERASCRLIIAECAWQTRSLCAAHVQHIRGTHAAHMQLTCGSVLRSGATTTLGCRTTRRCAAQCRRHRLGPAAVRCRRRRLGPAAALEAHHWTGCDLACIPWDGRWMGSMGGSMEGSMEGFDVRLVGMLAEG